MLSTFNKQLNTKVFSNICKIEQLSFSLGKQKYKGVITDIFYIQKWFFKGDSKSMTNTVFKQLNRIDKDVYLVYKFPKNWRWLKHKNNIYFIYTESYDVDSKEFKTVFDYLETSLKE